MKLGAFNKKIKSLLVVCGLLVTLGVAVVLGKNASNYFARASVCPAKNVTSVNVTANSAIIAWDTDDKTQGRVEYGTNSTSLTFTQPESTSDTVHKVPLTLLTPNTVYYYLIGIGNLKCDSTNQSCTDNCVPYSFTTQPFGGADKDKTASPSAQPSMTPRPTSALSQFCKEVQKNIGKGKNDRYWGEIKQFDIDGNGIINGVDVIKCQKSGK
jgi:hypothetical protein